VLPSAGAHEGTLHADNPETPVLTAETMPLEPAKEVRAREYFTDLPVVTQDGTELQFFSDVLKDRVVLVSLFYTKCPQACPLTTQKLAEVQEFLGEDLGSKIFLISITLDPENDTPEVIKEYAGKFLAREGWMFLTGKKKDLQLITYRLGHTSSEIEAHNTQFMIGNVNREHWAKMAPNLPAEIIGTRLRLMASDTAAN
jgi:cytochrome oxidase Cu insertion factor (SCO1/SenC/PrrC family)